MTAQKMKPGLDWLTAPYEIQVKGIVKYFDQNVGFIRHDRSNPLGDVLVHVDVLIKEGYKKLPLGYEIELTAVRKTKGYRATNISKLGPVKNDQDPRVLLRSETPDWKTGTLQGFYCDRGFGFIQIDESPSCAFLHMSVVKKCNMFESFDPSPGVKYKVKWGHLKGKMSITEIAPYQEA